MPQTEKRTQKTAAARAFRETLWESNILKQRYHRAARRVACEQVEVGLGRGPRGTQGDWKDGSGDIVIHDESPVVEASTRTHIDEAVRIVGEYKKKPKATEAPAHTFRRRRMTQ